LGKTSGNIILFAFLLLLSYEASSQVITGVIIDRDSKYPLKYANVYIKNTNIGTVSNNDGKFNFPKPLLKITDTLVISHVGYATFYYSTFDCSIDTTIVFELIPIAINLPEISIAPFDFCKTLSILKNTISVGKKTYPFNTDGFFRQILIENDTIKEIVELSVTNYYDYKKNSYQLKILQGKSLNKEATISYVNLVNNYIKAHDISFTLPDFLDKNRCDKFDFALLGFSKYDSLNICELKITNKNEKTSKLSFAKISVDIDKGTPIYMTVFFKPDKKPNTPLLLGDYNVVSIDSSFYSSGFRIIDNHLVMLYSSMYLKTTFSKKSTGQLLHQTLIISFVNNEFAFENACSFDNSTTYNQHLPLYKQVFIDNDNWEGIPFWEIEKEFLNLPLLNKFNLKTE